MPYEHNDLRQLAEALDSFAGIVAMDWTSGEDWWLRFTAEAGSIGGIKSQLAVLRVLLETGTPTEMNTILIGTKYRIKGTDPLLLATRLRAARMELWRLR